MTDPLRSANFEFLRPNWPELADLGALAERYAHPDPASAVVKLRLFAEGWVGWVYHRLRLPRAAGSHLIDLLQADAFRRAMPPAAVDQLHALRVHGNKAAHGERPRPEVAVRLLGEAFGLARWLAGAFGPGLPPADPFAPPDPAAAATAARKLEAAEAAVARLLEELEAERAKARATPQPPAQPVAVAAAPPDERATRRRLIDVLLLEAGWDVGADGASTPTVGQEVTADGDRPDYVLYDPTGRPLAVVEAKRAAADGPQGLTQARGYAAALAAGGAEPLALATNGYEVWAWDGLPRLLAGFYGPDSLARRVHQRRHRRPLGRVMHDPAVIDRPYQVRAFRSVLDRFAAGHRRALLVLATGTGKTRVAVALADALLRAGWAGRVLFLCDRTELRKQASQAFTSFLPGQPRVLVSARTAGDASGSVYLATYPAMLRQYAALDPGSFDLVVCDESHRSIYDRYRELVDYFDARVLGLTATPLDPEVSADRDTYKLFGCEPGEPTDEYPLEDGVRDGFLVGFEAREFTPPYVRDGLRYSRLTEAERRQLDDQVPDPALVEYGREQIDKAVLDLESNRLVLRNLMEHGVRDAAGRLGKTIVFARNGFHARTLRRLFAELFPELGGDFCQVIYHEDPRAEALLDEFKKATGKLVVAVSVDMLDTGVDVPEVVNLVFAKPVYSKVKFLQMIGRGTRLCPDLFGPGRPKTGFRIFDHWQNFAFFQHQYTPPRATDPKPAPQTLFEARLDLAAAALGANDRPAFDLAVGLVRADLLALPRQSWFVRQQGQLLDRLLAPGVLEAFAPATELALRQQAAPLMRWRAVGNTLPALRFDELVARLQADLVTGAATAADRRAEVQLAARQLPVNLLPVRAKQASIDRALSADFWLAPTVAALEALRDDLRPLMQYRAPLRPAAAPPLVVDIARPAAAPQAGPVDVRLAELTRAAFAGRVRQALAGLFDTDPTLGRIRAHQPVSEADLQALVSLVLTRDPGLDLRTLAEYYPDAGPLDAAIRAAVGQAPGAVAAGLRAFRNAHPLRADQLRFLDLLEHHLKLYGAVPAERLWEPPFTRLSPDGASGVFPDPALLDELLALLPPAPEAPAG